MPKIECTYHGTKGEDISIHFMNHHVILAEQPTPPMEKGLTYGGCMASYSFLTADQAQELGMRLIIASARKKEAEENDTAPAIEKEELIKKIIQYVYPTTQIHNGEITAGEYVVNLAKSFANELFDRRMETEALPLIAELACILHKLGEIKY